MVQASKEKLAVKKQGVLNKGERHVVKRFQGASRFAPVKSKKVNSLQKKITSNIGANIENLMAARVLHEGGKLRVFKVEGDVTEFVKSGPQLSKLQVKLRAGQNAARKSKADAHQEALKKKKKETDPTAISLAEFLEPIKPKSEPAPREVPAIDEDDVAGPFFAEEANAFLGIEPEEKEKEEETSAIKKKTIKRMKETKKASSSSSSTTTTSTSSSGPTSAKNVLPGRRSGFKGVASESAAKLLEDGF